MGSGHYDSPTGLYYLWHRYYDPEIRRFLTVDPAFLLNGQRYSYCCNNPIALADPAGLDAGSWIRTLCDPIGQASSEDNAFRQSAYNDGEVAQAVMDWVPAYWAINGYYNLWNDSLKGCPISQLVFDGLEAVGGVAATFGGAASGAAWIGRVTGVAVEAAAGRSVSWRLGAHKSTTKWQNQMLNRGWTTDDISVAIENGKAFPAPNRVHPGNLATRYVHPDTGRFVVVDDVTNEILQIGGSNFIPLKP